MPVNMDQFLHTFIEESMEMLDDAEKILLHGNLASIDSADINHLFRIMHSIKGNSAVFNFNTIHELTHTLETFLNLIRNKKQVANENDIDLMLKVVDCLRTMIQAISDKKTMNESLAKELNKIIKKEMSNRESLPPKEKNKIAPSSQTNDSYQGWLILFCPKENTLQLDNDPLRLFTALAELGNLIVEMDTTKLPVFNLLDPTKCYLSWKLTLYSTATKNEIEDLFLWITQTENMTLRPIMPTGVPYETKVPSPASLRVSTEKIDHLVNMIGELVITESILNQIAENYKLKSLPKLNDILEHLTQNVRELQEHIMQIRMVPINLIFDHLPRMVHDMTKQMGKEIELIITGGDTKLDKTMVEKLSDPLLHIIRNALDHGIESPSVRISKGKSPTGCIRLNAYHEGGDIIVEISDDGSGLNKDEIIKEAISAKWITSAEKLTEDKIHKLILKPGFSTAKHISDISGRGVGLDVVQKNIDDIHGEIEIHSSEKTGATFILRVPLTLAIIDSQIFQIGTHIFTIPLASIAEIVKIDITKLKYVADDIMLYHVRDEYIPVIFFRKIFSLPDKNINIENKLLIIVQTKNERVGFAVDEVLNQQQIVVKTLETNYKKIKGISGVSVLGNGRIAFIIDIKSAIELVRMPKSPAQNEISTGTSEQERILFKEDELTPDKNFQFLTFLMSDRIFGVDLSNVNEIRSLEEITSVPNTPSYIKGAINVRGAIIPIIDLAERLKLTKRKFDLNTMIVTLNIKSNREKHCIGAIVDKVLDAYTVNYNQILPLPVENMSSLKPFIQGLINMDDKTIMIIKTSQLIDFASEEASTS